MDAKPKMIKSRTGRIKDELQKLKLYKDINSLVKNENPDCAVFRAVDKEDNQIYVLKAIPLTEEDKEEDKTGRHESEADIMKSLDHENIVKYFGQSTISVEGEEEEGEFQVIM